MTGMAAIAFCAAFTSCSKEITPMTQEEMVAAGVQKIYSDYEAAFQKVFGTPAAGHTWGFSDAASTRSVNVNGNLWETRPAVTAAEAAAVYAWVNKPKTQIPSASYYEVSPINLQNFFVTQVWGKNDNQNDNNAKYTNYDNGNVFGGEKMNHLQISKSSERLGEDGVLGSNDGGQSAINSNWDHANNFNASQNRDWDGNTMFVNWGTQNFAYHNSDDSRYHDKWIIVDGSYITDSEGVNHAGKYYVCFDFVGKNPNAYTNFQEPGVGNVTVPGAWKSVADAVAAGATASNDHKVASNWQKGNIVGGNMIVDANEYYTDWIIRLVEAQRKIEPADIRVMAEDLSAGESGEDFDFNDVVFDVYFSPNAGEAYVMVQAAGGTLPLKVHGTEVHGLWGQPTSMMINTSAETKGLNGVSGLAAQRINLTGITVNSKSAANTEIKIEVQKDVVTANGTVKQWIELKNTGAAACKIGVPPTTGIAVERTNVNGVLGSNEWVTNGRLWSTN